MAVVLSMLNAWSRSRVDRRQALTARDSRLAWITRVRSSAELRGLQIVSAKLSSFFIVICVAKGMKPFPDGSVLPIEKAVFLQ